MLISPNGQDYQCVGSLRICGQTLTLLHFCNILLQPLAQKPYRSYQHNSLMTLKLLWSVCSCPCSGTYAYLVENLRTHRHMWCVSDGNIVFMLLLCHFTAWEYTSHIKREPISCRKLPPYYLLAKALVNV